MNFCVAEYIACLRRAAGIVRSNEPTENVADTRYISRSDTLPFTSQRFRAFSSFYRFLKHKRDRFSRHLATIWLLRPKYFAKHRSFSLSFSISPFSTAIIYSRIYIRRKRETTPTPKRWKYSRPRFLYELRNRAIKGGTTEACAFHTEYVRTF